MAKPPERYDVVILDEREITTYPKLGEAAVTKVITYRAGDLPPRTVFIPAAEDNPKNRAQKIREDIERAKKFQPARLTV